MAPHRKVYSSRGHTPESRVVVSGKGSARASIRIFLVDDFQVVREGVKFMLSHDADIVVVGEAGSGSEALRQVAALAPDVVLLDLSLSDMPGLEVLTALHNGVRTQGVPVLAFHDDDTLVLEAAHAGARGYLLKQTTHEELTAAIRNVAAGSHYFGPDVVGALINNERRAQEQVRLTGRETEVLRLLVTGLANREIGEQLHIGPDTVKTHLGNIYRKMNVGGRTQAVVLALRMKLLG